MLELANDIADEGVGDFVDLADLHWTQIFVEVLFENLDSLLKRFLFSLFEKWFWWFFVGVIRVGSVGERFDDLLFLLTWQLREQLGVENVELGWSILSCGFDLFALLEFLLEERGEVLVFQEMR